MKGMLLMRSLKDSMDLAAQCNLAWLDPDKGYFPTGGFEVAHDTGRWWDSMLRYEFACGSKIPVDIENIMLSNIQKLMDNKLAFLLNNPDIEWMRDKSFFNSHNFREGIMALSALVKYKNSDWARKTGHKFLENINKYLKDDGTFDFVKIAKELNMPIKTSDLGFMSDGTTSGGRAIEAIIWFYEATGDKLALEVAGKLAEYHFANTINPNGTIAEKIISPENIGHNHSYLGTLRGLLLYGLLTGSEKYVNAVSNTYDVSIWENNISYAGWAPHDLGKNRFYNEDGDAEADPASCGDVVQIALWLALKANRIDLLDDVERLVRATLIPSQITDDPNPRRNGAWGIHRQPFDRGAILDVFAAVLHTLTDVYSCIITKNSKNIVSINMHFEISSRIADINIKENSDRIVTIRVKEKAVFKIRVPGWVKTETIKLRIDGKESEIILDKKNYLILKTEVKAGSIIKLSYKLPKNETIEEMKVSHKRFKLVWQGDNVVNCEPKVPIY